MLNSKQNLEPLVPHSNYSWKYTGPRVDSTADIAVFDNRNKRILLGRKSSDPIGKWRFPGGFADPKDANIKATALRELGEEVAILANSVYKHIWSDANLQYLGSFKIEDPRYVHSEDKIFTSLFLYSLLTHKGVPDLVAGDDLAEVKWFEIWEFVPALLDHHQGLGIAVYREVSKR